MLSNEIKQYLAQLEFRILTLEHRFRAIAGAVNTEHLPYPVCNQCGVHDPHERNYVCNQSNCCQGRNPDDDACAS